MEPTNLLIQHIERYTRFLHSEEKESILSFFTSKNLSKKQNIQEAGAVCDVFYFVIKGCLRSYYIKKNGTEQTLDFAIENWWLTDYIAFDQQSTSGLYIQSVEQTTILCINKENYTALLSAHPIMEQYFRSIFQRVYGAAQYRIKLLYEMSREELYFHFEEQFPAFIQRIPQYLLASYLGFSPEYLSEIKKKRFS